MSVASYPIQIKHIDRALKDTVRIYQDAVAYLIDIVTLRFDDIKDMSDLAARKHIEDLVHGTTKRTAVYKAFDERFYKFPSYFRRAAITAAIGAVRSWQSMVKNWEDGGRKGRKPRLKRRRNAMPATQS